MIVIFNRISLRERADLCDFLKRRYCSFDGNRIENRLACAFACDCARIWHLKLKAGASGAFSFSARFISVCNRLDQHARFGRRDVFGAGSQLNEADFVFYLTISFS